MNNKVISVIDKYKLIENGDSVIVALSGGADSVALLDVIVSLKEKYNLNIYAAHLNHNLRGEEAERDENFCKILCENYNVEFFVESLDIGALAKEQKISEELCGRNERYKFFERLSSKLNAKIATAHTASDNAETLIYNIARGTSLKGLSAIVPKRGNIIRPLIECTRSEIEDYCEKRGLRFVTDSTNLTDAYTRNMIRHRVIPQLKAVNPRFEQSAGRLSGDALELAQYLNRQSAEALSRCKTEFGYSCKALLACDKVVLKNALVLICGEFDLPMLESKHIDLMLDIIENGGAVDLGGRVKAVSKQGVFRIISCGENDVRDEFVPVRLEENMRFCYDGKIYFVSENNSEKENNNIISADFINKNAVFRTRREGDRFTYPKRKITKPLRKVLNEMKIPAEMRDRLLVLAVDNVVLWCENVGAALENAYNSGKELKINIFKA